MNNKFKTVYDKYHFLAGTPFKVDVALVVALFMAVFAVFGIDFCFNASANALSIGFVVVNIAGIVGSFVYIGNLKQTPVTYSEAEVRDFDFKKSMEFTRLLQKEVRQFVDDSKFVTSGRTQAGKYSNALRLLSFVVVFKKHAYIYIRLPLNAENRQDERVLMMIASDVADSLGLTMSSFQSLNIANNIGLGHYHFQTFKVMELR